MKTSGENIALYILKNLMPYRYKEIAPLYYGLIEDIKRMADYIRTISEGYDLAQAAICFPCAYVDKKLSDKVANMANP